MSIIGPCDWETYRTLSYPQGYRALQSVRYCGKMGESYKAGVGERLSVQQGPITQRGRWQGQSRDFGVFLMGYICG
jgi:hypothetical protein